MNDATRIRLMAEALEWYANSDNYWGRPIPLNVELDRRTLRIVHEYETDRPILADWGEKAATALVRSGLWSVQQSEGEQK